MLNTTLKGDAAERAAALLAFMYGPRGQEAVALVSKVLDHWAPRLPKAFGVRTGNPAPDLFDETDALLITYGDMIAPPAGDAGASTGSQKHVMPLRHLAAFLDEQADGIFSYVHILPFSPFSSDDGFSVKDYREVDPALGDWDDVKAVGAGRKLTFDLVLNHASAQGVWFRSFLASKLPYDRYFLTRPLDYDSSAVTRPRMHPLITPVRLDDGSERGIWTTFSADQVDLDFSNPAVLAEFLDILLGYAERGARMVRLDAIAYLWKTDGTSCVHLPETHAAVKFFRAVVDGLGLDCAILTETNVPHAENMSYFGAGDEAHIVYNFSLPPLVLHAFTTGDAGPLSRWAGQLTVPPGGTLLNFLASHDGIGVTPAAGLVDDYLPVIRAVQERGGLVSYKATPAGQVPYELNISWADAVAPADADEPERAAALVASYAIACAMDGVPAVYFHSLVGSRSWREGPGLLGYNRSINRQRLARDELESALDDSGSLRSRVFRGMSNLLRSRSARPAFSPAAARKAHPAQGPVFTVERGTGDDAILALVNCGRTTAAVSVPGRWRDFPEAFDPVAACPVALAKNPDGRITVPGFGVLWLTPGR